MIPKISTNDHMEAIHPRFENPGTTGERVDLCACWSDGPEAEREQGITMMWPTRYFSTAKRKFIIDEPPARACTHETWPPAPPPCDLDILIDARYGVGSSDPKRHSFIASFAGHQAYRRGASTRWTSKLRRGVFNQIMHDYRQFASGHYDTCSIVQTALHFCAIVCRSRRPTSSTASERRPHGTAGRVADGNRFLETVGVAADRTSRTLDFRSRLVLRART